MSLVLTFPRFSASVEPEDGIIAILEHLLERARLGEIQSVVVVSAASDGHPECGMELDRGHATAIIGALHVAEAEIARLLDVDLS